MAIVTKKTSSKRSRSAGSSRKKAKPQHLLSCVAVVSAEVFDSLINDAGKKRKPTPAMLAMIKHYRDTIKK